MRYDSTDDFLDNWLLYLLIFSLSIIVIANIGVKIWQYSLEKQYNVKYEEAEAATAEYREKYYSMDEALDSFLIRLNHITKEAKVIVKQNIIAAIVEMVLLTITFIPTIFMYQIFKNNREISKFHLTETTTIILTIETAIALLTCFMDIKGAFETIGQYRQIYGLVEDMFTGLGTLMDSINFQINQY